jgi:PAS domain S-box-containing protein
MKDEDKAKEQLKLTGLRQRSAKHEKSIKQNELAQKELKRITWLLTKSIPSEENVLDRYEPSYGNLVKLNYHGLLLDMVGESVLEDIAHDYLDLLDTSAAVYEKNGDYALGIFSSGWCQFLDNASRKLCDTKDNREALLSGKWLCHESCWTEASKVSIETGKPVDIECSGGIHLYAVPIQAGDDIVGSINIGYGDPPRDAHKLREIANKYRINYEELKTKSEMYESRPTFIIDIAKRRLSSSSRLIATIVSHKRTEEKLRGSEAKFRSIFNKSPVGIEIYDSAGMLQNANQASLDIFGISDIEEVKGFDLFKDPNITSEIKERLYKGETVRYESTFDFEKVKEYQLYKTIKSGSSYLDLLITPLKVEGEKNLGGYLVQVQDISERKRNEEAIQKSNERFELAVRGTSDGIWDWDIKTNANYLSPRFCELLGYKSDELVNEFNVWKSLLHPEDHDRVVDLIRQHIEEHIPYDVEYRLRTKNGEYRWYHARGQAIWDETGNPFRMAGSISDITERKRTEERLSQAMKELARSNAELEQFAYITSHDLQEPLRMVSSFVQLLAKRYKGRLDQDADDFINYAVDGVNRMHNLITDLLAYSRVGTRGEEFKPVSSEVALDGALSNLQMSIEQSGAVVTRDPLPVVMGDNSQLVQLFQNLISNAIKFCVDRAPRIHVSADQQGDEWVFSVRDNGIGIALEYFGRILLIFQRLHDRKQYPGTGIGLAICKKVVERHGGRIWVESELGVGSSFYFTIPEQRELIS